MTDATLPISVTILTKNSASLLPKVLTALKGFQEVVIYDTGSTDATCQLAADYANVSIHYGYLDGFGPTHNRASNLATCDWILSVDSDEIVTEELFQELLHIQLDPDTVYSFPRHNYYRGKWIRWCGWYPDRQARLYHRKKTHFDNALVHEAIITHGMKQVALRGALQHYSYEKTADFLAKMQSYSQLFAEQHAGKRRSSPSKACLHGCFAFLKSYILKRGFLGGSQGFEISVYNANTAFYKYLKLYEANLKKKT